MRTLLFFSRVTLLTAFALISVTASASSCELTFEDKLHRVGTTGLFEKPSPQALADMQTLYRKWVLRKQDGESLLPYRLEDISPVGKGDIFKLPGYEAQRDIKKLHLEKPTIYEAKQLIQDRGQTHNDLKQFGYDGESPLAIIEGFSGLWTRGNLTNDDSEKTIKALLPINLAALIGLENSQYLMRWEKNKEHPLDRDFVRYLYSVRQHKHAFSFALLKLAQVAVQSAHTRRYHPVKFWTGSHVHDEIHAYERNLPNIVASFPFTQNRRDNRLITGAIQRYLAATASRNDTVLFGYERGYHALTGHGDGAAYNENTKTSGEGAGMFKPYMDETGLTAQLKNRGVRYLMFRNAEVMGPIDIELLSYVKAGKPVGLGTVDFKQGYKGGSPSKVRVNGKPRYIVLEDFYFQDALPQGRVAFSNNTVIMNIDLEVKPDYGFEPPKAEGSRMKFGAGDITRLYDTSLLHGDIPINFENFKHYSDVIIHGQAFLDYHIGRLTYYMNLGI